MNEIFQLILGIPGNESIFFTERDEDRLLDYAKIYKDRFELDLLAYCLQKKSAHFIIYDGPGKKELFGHNLTEAYGYYLQLVTGKEVRMSNKLIAMDSIDQYMNMMKLFHQQGRNSLIHYKQYSRYVKDPLLSVPLVLNTFSLSHKGDQEKFMEELVSEPLACYEVEFKKAQVFKKDKLSKRRERARDYMESFCREHNLQRDLLSLHHDTEMKKLLIKGFREETDLSFRDIGYVLGLSHTTVIRLYRESE